MGDDAVAAVVDCTPVELEEIRAGRRCAFASEGAARVLSAGDTIMLRAWRGDGSASGEPLRLVIADVCKDVLVFASAFDELWTMGGVETLRLAAPNIETNGSGNPMSPSVPFWTASASVENALGARMLSKEGPHDALRQLVRALNRARS